MKRCPFCAEEIQDAAVVCKHCRKDLPVAASAKASPGGKKAIGCAGLLFVFLAIGWCAEKMQTPTPTREPIAAVAPRPAPPAPQPPPQPNASTARNPAPARAAAQPAPAPPAEKADPEADAAVERINQTIRAKCLRDWPSDFSVRAYCERTQREAVIKIGRRNMDTSADRITIRQKCASEWPDDFSVRNYCEEQQLAALAELSR